MQKLSLKERLSKKSKNQNIVQQIWDVIPKTKEYFEMVNYFEYKGKVFDYLQSIEDELKLRKPSKETCQYFNCNEAVNKDWGCKHLCLKHLSANNFLRHDKPGSLRLVGVLTTADQSRFNHIQACFYNQHNWDKSLSVKAVLSELNKLALQYKK